MTFDVVGCRVGADVAYSVCYERGDVAIDRAEAGPITIRVTHGYQRSNGIWRITHRHGRYAPVDQSPH
jgi:hypothetical protein